MSRRDPFKVHAARIRRQDARMPHQIRDMLYPGASPSLDTARRNALFSEGVRDEELAAIGRDLTERARVAIYRLKRMQDEAERVCAEVETIVGILRTRFTRLSSMGQHVLEQVERAQLRAFDVVEALEDVEHRLELIGKER